MMVIEKFKNAEDQVYAVLSYEPAKNYLLMKWIGYSTDAEIKTVLLRVIDWQRREGRPKGCKFHVHDTKEIEGAWAGMLDWINTEFFPECYKAGLRYNISVLSPDLFSALSSQALLRKHNPVVPTVLFETLSQAERWLTEKYKQL